VSASSNSRVGWWASTARNSAAAVALTACIDRGTRSSNTSKVRVLPLPFSADSTASRGVDSNAVTAWQCAAQSVTATRAAGDGKAT
jgi:hypothetical protein